MKKHRKLTKNERKKINKMIDKHPDVSPSVIKQAAQLKVYSFKQFKPEVGQAKVKSKRQSKPLTKKQLEQYAARSYSKYAANMNSKGITPKPKFIYMSEYVDIYKKQMKDPNYNKKVSVRQHIEYLDEYNVSVEQAEFRKQLLARDMEADSKLEAEFKAEMKNYGRSTKKARNAVLNKMMEKHVTNEYIRAKAGQIAAELRNNGYQGNIRSEVTRRLYAED